MEITRRQFMGACGAAAAVAVAPAGIAGADTTGVATLDGFDGSDWDAVRRQFPLRPDRIHMSALLIASHPAPVRAAIERHRTGLDADPTGYLQEHGDRLHRATVEAAAAYVNLPPYGVALTESTTTGIGLIYNGLRIRDDQEILTTEHDYYATHEALRLVQKRTGCRVRRVRLYDSLDTVSGSEMTDRIVSEIGAATRALALTWVHSSTGLRIPVRAIAHALEAVNASRDDADQVLLCVDGVHGFGNQDYDFAELGCDFLMAGCHKWLFGPRGTGIVAASDRGWAASVPTIPTFTDPSVWHAWLTGADTPEGRTAGRRMSPGGYKAFEHQWALADAFGFHAKIGRSAIARRTAELAGRLKDGLADIPGVRVRTPRDPALSAGIVSFDIAGWGPTHVVAALRARGVVASAAPYATSHARLTPSIQNSMDEVDAAVAAVRAIAA